MKHIFIVGSKGIPAKYGGFETFVENLTAHRKSPEIIYHVSCMSDNRGNFLHNNAECFNVKVPVSGPIGRILHVSLALKEVEKWKLAHPKEEAGVYILGCRIGPLIAGHTRKLHKLGMTIFCNPDGLEWRRDKWNALEKKILRFCEACLVKYSDEVICDSENIERYIEETYPSKVEHTVFIAYGAEVQPSLCDEEKLLKWYEKYSIKKSEYYLIVGRFVPENNYEIMIREFVKSTVSKDLVIITNVEKGKFYDRLEEQTGFEKDSRIKFVGTVYDQELLKKIRENAYGYLHGHEVGGTNPSLLEALASTRLNLLLDVGFNREVAEESALYWTKEYGDLRKLISFVEDMDQKEIDRLGVEAKRRIRDRYSWDSIVEKYEKVWKAI